jgi:uncharacterized membrane protein
MHINLTLARRLVPVIVVGVVAYALVVGVGINAGYIANALVLTAALAIPVLIATLLFRLARQPWSVGRQAPLEIAKERFARGEIDRVAFEEIRDALEDH